MFRTDRTRGTGRRFGATLAVVPALLAALATAAPAYAGTPTTDTPTAGTPTAVDRAGALAAGLPARVATTRVGVTAQIAVKPELNGKRVAGKTFTLPRSAGVPRMLTGEEGAAPVCTPYLSLGLNNNGGVQVQVTFLGELVCNFYLNAAGQTYLIERTTLSSNPDAVLYRAPQFGFNNYYYGYSIGSIVFDGRLYEGARTLEIGFDLILQTTNGAPWAGCFELPAPERYLAGCNGQGTPTLSTTVGSGEFFTGLAAYNPAAYIRDIPGITLATVHSSGIVDAQSTARQNIVDTANGLPAKTSFYSQVGTTNVRLSDSVLRGILSIHLINGYSFSISELAGGMHTSANSLHYQGKAVDINVINGQGVTASNPLVNTIKSLCRAYGATQVLGPGDAGHDTHIDCGWP